MPTLRRTLCLFVLMLPTVAWAQAKASWITDSRTGCRVQNRHPTPNETIQWSGGCQNGLAQGRGTLEWFKSGQPSGKSEGEWQAGILNGRAFTTYPDGRRHEGEYRNGQPDGRGILIFPNGGRLDVAFRDGKMNGRGVATMPDGSKLDAEFVDDQAVRGTWVYANGNRYEGELKDFKPNGQGVYAEAGGGHFRGQFRDGRIDGPGTMNFANGDRYEGVWQGDRPNGRGTLFRQGRVNSGLWIDGCLSQQNADGGRWANVNKSARDCGFQ